MLVSEAARRLEMNPQTLRLALQQGLFPFGKAIRTSPNRFVYYINEKALERYLNGFTENDSYYWDRACSNPERMWETSGHYCVNSDYTIQGNSTSC